MFLTRQVGKIGLAHDPGAWEMSDVSDADFLRGQRLYKALMLLKPAGLAETDWALKAGLNRGFFTSLKKAPTSPRSDTLRKLLKFVGHTEADLYAAADGHDVRERAVASQRADDETIDVREVDIGYAMGPGTNVDDYPDVGTMRFGLSFLQSLTRAETDMLYVARGDGDSMSPTLINGDTVLIDRSQRQLNMQDRIWAVSIQGAGMIKRLRTAGRGKVRVLSDNSTIPPDEVAEDDLHIVGRVIWVGRRV